MLWSGAENAIPSGWVLCNGSNSTPDLRNRFVVGAGNSYNVGDTGGADSVTLSLSQIPSHNHSVGVASFSGSFEGFRRGSSIGSNSTGSAGGGGAHENRPPYYALCYIMKT